VLSNSRCSKEHQLELQLLQVSTATPLPAEMPVSSGSGASFAKMFSSLNRLMELMGIRHLTYLDAAINAARHV